MDKGTKLLYLKILKDQVEHFKIEEIKSNSHIYETKSVLHLKSTINIKLKKFGFWATSSYCIT